MFTPFHLLSRIVLCSHLLFVCIAGISQDIPAMPKSKKSGTPIKIKKVVYQYEYPTVPIATKQENIPEKPWKVYSDRSENVAYSNEKLHTPFAKYNFLDSFYVKTETKEALELIKCTPGLISNNSIDINETDKVEWAGWIEKSKLILSEKSYLNRDNRRPFKSFTILKGNNIFENLKVNAEELNIKKSANPEHFEELKNEGGFGEIVYVYKTHKDKILIGTNYSFNSKSINKVLLGWVSTDFVQEWGQRLCLEPASQEKKKILFTSKDSAIFNKSVANKGNDFGSENCHSKRKLSLLMPVLEKEITSNSKQKTTIYKTGGILNILDKNKSYVFNINGTKIEYQNFCRLIDKSKNVNIVFAVNNNNDTKEYMYAFNAALQELSGFLVSKRGELNFKFGVTDCNSIETSTSLKMDLTEQFPDIISSISLLLKKYVEEKSISGNPTMINGLLNASKLLKGKESENNIIIMISSQADNAQAEIATKLLKETIATEASKLNSRFLFIQPYCGTNPAYANFVQQAKLIIKSSSEKATVIRKEKMVGNENPSSNLNNFRSVLTGPNNIYCLDFPQNANNQGILVFPTIGYKLEKTQLTTALDTLLAQVKQDNENIIASMNQVFNSPSTFNNKVNPPFQKFYSKAQALPSDVPTTLKNISYQYFLPGYVAIDENSATETVKQQLFLSSEEYDELVTVYKNLHFDLITPEYGMTERNNTYQNILKTLRRYSDERQVYIQEYTSFSDFFLQMSGLQSENNFLKKFKVADLIATNSGIKEDMKLLVNHINKRLSILYSLKEKPEQSFFSNGMKYYLIPEQYLP